MAENEFLASIQREGAITPSEEDKEGTGKEAPPAPPADEKTPEDKPASPAEGDQKDESGKPKEGEDKPLVFEAFHKHPRWIALQKDLKDLTEFRTKALPILEKLGEIPDKKTDEIPGWFSELFGENPAAWKKYQVFTKSEREQLQNEILTTIRSEMKQATEESKKWESWVDEEVVRLESDSEIVADLKKLNLKFNRNEVLKVALDYRPSDDQGNISLRLAYDIWKSQKLSQKPEDPNATDEKKKLADKTMGKGKGEGDKKDYRTPADLQGKSFRDLVPNE